MFAQGDMGGGRGGRGGFGRGRGMGPMNPSQEGMMGRGYRPEMNNMMHGGYPPEQRPNYGRGQPRFHIDDYNGGGGGSYNPFDAEEPRNQGHRGIHPPDPRMISPSERPQQRPLIDGEPRGPGTALPTTGNKPSPTTTKPPIKFANDCEIIVTAKPQQAYAEMIEKAIRGFQLKVDLMFPKPDVKLSNFIDNISSMGTIFAVVIRPDNEAHRSVSVHVLRGTVKPEEHRNMPLSAAYLLIQDKYAELKRKEIGAMPEKVRGILKALLEERILTDLEYVESIKFLQERRRKQKAFENRTNNVVGDNGMNEILKCPESDELQQKILSILTGEISMEALKKAEGTKIGDLLVPRPSEPLGSLDSDPKFRSAINSLMEPSFLTALNNANQMPAGRGGGGGFGRGYAGHGGF